MDTAEQTTNNIKKPKIRLSKKSIKTYTSKYTQLSDINDKVEYITTKFIQPYIDKYMVTESNFVLSGENYKDALIELPKLQKDTIEKISKNKSAIRGLNKKQISDLKESLSLNRLTLILEQEIKGLPESIIKFQRTQDLNKIKLMETIIRCLSFRTIIRGSNLTSISRNLNSKKTNKFSNISLFLNKISTQIFINHCGDYELKSPGEKSILVTDGGIIDNDLQDVLIKCREYSKYYEQGERLHYNNNNVVKISAPSTTSHGTRELNNNDGKNIETKETSRKDSIYSNQTILETPSPVIHTPAQKIEKSEKKEELTTSHDKAKEEKRERKKKKKERKKIRKEKRREKRNKPVAEEEKKDTINNISRNSSYHFELDQFSKKSFPSFSEDGYESVGEDNPTKVQSLENDIQQQENYDLEQTQSNPFAQILNARKEEEKAKKLFLENIDNTHVNSQSR